MTCSTWAWAGRWKVTSLGKLDFTPNVDATGAFGINNAGQCAYSRVISGKMHAFIYLPAAAYGYSAGIKDLNTLSSGTENIPNIARDINEYGYVVGETGDVSTTPLRATVWQVSSTGGTPFTVLGTLSSAYPWSSAHALSNASNPTIIGDSGRDAGCICDTTEGTERNLVRGFYMVLSTGTGLTEIAPGAGDAYNHARDVNLNSDKVGWAGCQDSTTADGCYTEPCYPTEDAAQWTTARTTLADLSATGAAQAKGNNENGQICGWGYRNSTGFECSACSLVWASASATPVPLGDTMPAGQGTHQSKAEGLNNNTLVQVVGWNDDLQLGLFWEQGSSGSFSVLDLNSSTAIGTYNTRWIIRQAHDINNSEWIIAWGDAKPPGSGSYALLLTPDSSSSLMGDSNGDKSIDAADLAKVIDGWGECAEGIICDADITGDGVVDSADLKIVMRNYGSTVDETVEAVPDEVIEVWLAGGGAEAVAAGGISAQALATALNQPIPSAALVATLAEAEQD